MFPTEQTIQLRTGGAAAAVQDGGLYVVEGNILTDEGGPGTGSEPVAFGVSSRAIGAFQIGETAEFSDGDETLTI